MNKKISLLIIALVAVLSCYFLIQHYYKNSDQTTAENKINFTISGGFDGGTCVLVKENRKKFLPTNAEQYICDAYSVTPYKFNRYLYPTDGEYKREIPNGSGFSRKIDSNTFVDEYFIDPAEYQIHTTKDSEWIAIGCYTNTNLCNAPTKIYLNGTSTREYTPN